MLSTRTVHPTVDMTTETLIENYRACHEWDRLALYPTKGSRLDVLLFAYHGEGTRPDDNLAVATATACKALGYPVVFANDLLEFLELDTGHFASMMDDGVGVRKIIRQHSIGRSVAFAQCGVELPPIPALEVAQMFTPGE